MSKSNQNAEKIPPNRHISLSTNPIIRAMHLSTAKFQNSKITYDINNNVPSGGVYCAPGSDAYKDAMRAFYRGIYGIKNEVEIGKRERVWLKWEIGRHAYLPEYYLKEALEAKIKRFVDYANALRNDSNDPNDRKASKASNIFIKYKELKGIQDEKQQTASKEELAKILEQAAIEHAMRLFLLTVPKKKTQENNKNNNNTDTSKNSEDSQGNTKGKQEYYEFFQAAGATKVAKNSHLARYETFEKWFKTLPLSKEWDQKKYDDLKGFYNGYIKYIKAANCFLPKDLMKNALSYLNRGWSDSFSVTQHYHLGYFNNPRNLFEVNYEPKTVDELETVLANRFDVYQNLVSLNISSTVVKVIEDIEEWDPLVNRPNIAFAKVVESITKFSKLRKLHLGIVNKKQFDQLISVLEQPDNNADSNNQNPSAFWENLQLEISWLTQDVINFIDAKELLRKHSKLLLRFRELTVSDLWKGQNCAIDEIVTMPERLHVRGDFVIQGSPVLKVMNFLKGVQIRVIYLDKNPVLKEVNFPKGMQVDDALFLSGNSVLEEVNFPEGMQVACNLTLGRNKALKSVHFSDGVRIGGPFCISETPQLTNVTVGQGVEIKYAYLYGCKAGVLKTLFHDVRGMKVLELDKGFKVVGSGLFVALLLNPGLKKPCVRLCEECIVDTNPHFLDKEWFDLRDKLLESDRKETFKIKLTVKELELFRQARGDLQDYLDSHYPDVKTEKPMEELGINSNDENKKAAQTKKAPAKDYNMIEQLVAGLGQDKPDGKLEIILIAEQGSKEKDQCCIL